MSALRDNVEKKGKNSYYYAHEKVIDGPKWDGNREPRLLYRTASNSPTPVHKSLNASNHLKNYSWSDDISKATVYISLEETEEGEKVQLSEEDFVLNWTNNSVSIDIKKNPYLEVWHKLEITRLFGEIVDCRVKLKEGRVLLVLVKKEKGPWSSLKIQ
mmetsp:Transcript_10170/g.14384  ORF Transcript_10170/g.14384 Transcript_10170/m.14384 type:complete len:158 (+) Transcript_10170:83-556(+)|eukprot:CAMPEP_0171475820 /NCGR_PEP_ID=MMETSP0946-20130122/3222_1 /TAXON_ID=109269 /ORGANISM="Vaucheria litorea, Strain CCMP2940" /LENGTH=157 /DNA_ID=CAMNT_0012005963 /DNA_START=59 /DNA_END=532 /DNA_ORIENTATION=+